MIDDSQQIVSCPYNESHKFARNKLVWHLNRCKDKQKVGHQFRKCSFNSMHIIRYQELSTHQAICPDRAEIRALTISLQRTINRTRERSREKYVKQQQEEEKIKIEKQSDEEYQHIHTLSQCEQCQVVIRMLEDFQQDDNELAKRFKENIKLQKYLKKYKELI